MGGLPMSYDAPLADMRFVLDEVAAVPAVDHRRGRAVAGARLGIAKAALSRKAGIRRVDRDDEPDRAAGRIGSGGIADARRAGIRPALGRALPHRRPEDLHHLW